MIRGASELREAYRKESVARSYVEERFKQPLGALLHARQSEALRRFIRRVAPDRVLEIAPGPARLTSETLGVFKGYGVMLDASAQMLTEGRRRLAASTTWHAVQGDVFSLPFRSEFDLAYTFRLIRHFERSDRLRIYAQLARVLKRGGRLMFDAVNETISASLRKAAPGEYQHFDALMRPDELREELHEGGFALEGMQGVQHRHALMGRAQVLVAPRSRLLARVAMECLDRSGGEPLEWIVTCRRQ